MTRLYDLTLMAQHLEDALALAKEQNLDAHLIAEIDHVAKQAAFIAEEEASA